MIDINLLPWRPKKRKQAIVHKIIFSCLGIIVGMGGWLICHNLLNNTLKKIDLKKQVIEEALGKEAASVDKTTQLKNKYMDLLKQETFIQQLTNYQKDTRDEFKQIVSIVAFPLSLSEVHDSGKSLTLKGEIDSVDKLALFVSTLDKKKYFSPIRLKRMTKSIGSDHFDFVLSMPAMHKKDPDVNQ